MRTELLEVGARLMVAEPYGCHGRRHKPGTVKRKTPKGLTVVTVDAYPPHGAIAHEVTFNPDGYERGHRYGGRSLEPFDQNVLDAEIREAQTVLKRRRLEDFNTWRNMPEEMIWKVCELLDGTHEKFTTTAETEGE